MGKSQKINNLIDTNVPKEQNILLKISQSIISTLDYEKVLQIISDGMSEMLEIETAAIYLLENKKELYLGATTPPLDSKMPDELRRALLHDHPHIHKTVKSRKPQVIPDTYTAQLSTAEKVVVELRKLRSIVYFPFIQKEKVLGVLILGTSNKSRTFSTKELDFGQTVANQLSIGIQNARLHHDLLIKNRKLEESEYLYRNLFDQAAEGIFLMDLEGKIVQVNKAFAQMHGYSVNEILRMNIKSLDVLNKKTFSERNYMMEKVLKGDMAQMEVEHYHKDGHIIPLLVNIQLLNINNVKYSLCFHQDLTNQKKVENELKNHRDNLKKLVKEKTRELDNAIEELTSTNEELSSKNKIIKNQNKELKKALKDLREAQSRLIQVEKMASLGILTAGVAHEINNPLNYIMGSYLALESYFDETECDNPELIEKLLNRIKTGLDKATNIVKGLNQFSRDNIDLHEDCEINIIIDNCLMILGNQIKDRIDIIKHYEEENISVKGNVGQLHQVFLNLLSNAVQAISNKGKIIITTKRKDDLLITEIEDTGEGITKENILKITDPFFTTKDPGKGTGLGLSITYSILQEHNGNMEFESIRGKGTKVKLSIPFGH